MSRSSSSISGMLHPMMWPGEPRTSLPHRRTKQACDNCKARKAKCSNTKPCTNCQEADVLCTSVKAMTRKSARDWEIEMLRSERTRLVNAVKILHQQLSSRAPELYAPSTANHPPTTTSPPAEPLSVNEIVELIELGQEKTKRGDGGDSNPDLIHVTPATPSSSPSSCVSSSAAGPPTPDAAAPAPAPAPAPAAAVDEAQQQQDQSSAAADDDDAMAAFGLELDCVDDFQWQPPDGADLPASCWAGEGWPELGAGGGGGGLAGGLVGLDGVDQLAMEWTAGGGGGVWQ